MVSISYSLVFVAGFYLSGHLVAVYLPLLLWGDVLEANKVPFLKVLELSMLLFRPQEQPSNPDILL